jgi:hypothetical protein
MWREVKREAGIAIEPGPHLGVFMSDVIVQDHIDTFAVGHA